MNEWSERGRPEQPPGDALGEAHDEHREQPEEQHEIEGLDSFHAASPSYAIGSGSVAAPLRARQGAGSPVRTGSGLPADAPARRRPRPWRRPPRPREAFDPATGTEAGIR